MEKEVAFQDQLLASLRQIKHVNALLDEGAVMAEEKNVLDALYKLESKPELSLMSVYTTRNYPCRR